jgi:DNA-binding transcriptional MerR regulator
MSQKTFEELCELFGYTPKGRLLDTSEVAQIFGIDKHTLRINRMKGIGPPFIKGPKFVRYSEMDVFRWLYENRRTSTSEGRAA